jgi:peptidoglycan hydrolase-like protein with peptidoglycan-binding domain
VARTGAAGATDPQALDAAAPDPVEGVTAAVPRRGEVTLAWPAVADRGTARAYRLEALDAAGNAAGAEAVLTARAGGVRYRVALDGTPVATVAGPAARLRGLPPARAREVTVTALDAAGNAAAPSPAVVVLPTPGPAPRLALDVRRGAVRPGVPLDVRARITGQAAGAVEWRVDGALVHRGPRLTLSLAAVGRHRVVATLHGRTGTPVRAATEVVVDDVAPDLTLLLRRDVLRAVARDALSGVGSLRMVHGPGQPADLAGGRRVHLPDGLHRIVVRGVDRAGNRADLDERVMADGTPPVLRVTVPGVSARGRIAARIDVADRVSGVRRVTLDGRPLDEGVTAVRMAAGRRHVVRAEDNAGNAAAAVLRVALVPRLPRRAASLDGARGDQIRWGGGGRVSGVRAQILRGVQAQLMATGDLPAGWTVGDRYTLPLLRTVQAFQRRVGLPPHGTIGPATRAALERATRPARTVVGR